MRNYVAPRNFHKPQTEEIPPAPLEIRDYVYKSLLKLLPASDHECLTVGAKGLRERGLENFEDYGALPCTASERKNLAAQLRLLHNQNFPSFIREKPQGIALIPGFWISESGEICLWLEKDYSHPLLVVPFRNSFGKIQACRLRFAGSLGRRTKRYLWLSLPACDYQDNPAVLCQLAKLISLLNTSEHFQSFSENVEILDWEQRFKGIDDALFNKAAIVEFSLSEWFGNLSVDNRVVLE